MAAPADRPTESLMLVWGGDDHAVRARARQVFNQWCEAAGGFDHETIDASAANAGDALKAIHRLRESLQTLPFLGGTKIVWFKQCTFVGEDVTSGSKAVTEALGSLADEFKKFRWENVRLLISAGKVDRRKIFYKTLEKLGRVETFAGLSPDDRDWEQQAETYVVRELRARGLEISEEALAEMVAGVGPNSAQLANEVEKLSLYASGRQQLDLADVQAVVSRQKHARAFALGEALGDRDLPKLLRALDEELWAVKSDTKRSEIGLLYGLISKVRVMILGKELVREGLLKMEASFDRFKAQLSNLPADRLPDDKRFNPLAVNPYILFKATSQSRHYSLPELIQAMEILLDCNRRLISSSLDEALVLQSALVRIAGRTSASPTPART